MSEMTNVGDHVKCPQCGREALVVWISQNEEKVAIKCMGYHSHVGKSPSSKKEPVKGVVFLVEASRKE